MLPLKDNWKTKTQLFDELATVLVEIESTLNNRPLTYLYGDEEGPSHSVMPADNLRLPNFQTPTNLQFEVVSTAKSLTKWAKHQLRVLSTFISQWNEGILVKFAREKRNYSASIQY